MPILYRLETWRTLYEMSWEVLDGSWEVLGVGRRSWEVLGEKIWHFILGPVPNYLIWVIGVQASLTWLIS